MVFLIPRFIIDEQTPIAFPFLLKEQERVTRHACADAVLNVDGMMIRMYPDTYWIDKDDAHAACINAQAT